MISDLVISISLISSNVLVAVLAILQYLTRRDVAEVKHATNSMKDELVAATQVAAESKGRDDERTRQEAQ